MERFVYGLWIHRRKAVLFSHRHHRWENELWSFGETFHWVGNKVKNQTCSAFESLRFEGDPLTGSDKVGEVIHAYTQVQKHAHLCQHAQSVHILVRLLIVNVYWSCLRLFGRSRFHKSVVSLNFLEVFCGRLSIFTNRWDFLQRSKENCPNESNIDQNLWILTCPRVVKSYNYERTGRRGLGFQKQEVLSVPGQRCRGIGLFQHENIDCWPPCSSFAACNFVPGDTKNSLSRSTEKLQVWQTDYPAHHVEDVCHQPATHPQTQPHQEWLMWWDYCTGRSNLWIVKLPDLRHVPFRILWTMLDVLSECPRLDFCTPLRSNPPHPSAVPYQPPTANSVTQCSSCSYLL